MAKSKLVSIDTEGVNLTLNVHSTHFYDPPTSPGNVPLDEPSGIGDLVKSLGRIS